MPQTTEIVVNGTKRRVEGQPDRMLLGVLRDELHLTGAKYGCGEGACGACTVLVNGRAQRSCITKLASVAGAPITTIEGLARNGSLHPVQQAFLDLDAMQCGYCTPGMIMSAVALLDANSRPTREEIVKAMDGNICRCCTYPRIVAAVQKAAGARRGAKREGA